MFVPGALLALHVAGIRIGTEVSFVGCDDATMMAVYQPPIAVVRRDVVGMGVAAGELLLADLNEGAAIDVPRESYSPDRIRASCELWITRVNRTRHYLVVATTRTIVG